MLVRYIKPILLITGLITVAPVLKFLFPDLVAFFPGVDIAGEAGRLIVRHQALAIACIGGLLVYAAFNVAIRPAALVAAIASKGGMVWLLLGQLGNPAFAKMNGTLIFDALCVVLYALYLIRAPRSR